MTLQFVFSPQFPTHGLEHLWFTHAMFDGHSELTTHSGRQLDGEPKKFGKQEHTLCLLTSLHWLLAPQGDGLQGFVSTT